MLEMIFASKVTQYTSILAFNNSREAPSSELPGDYLSAAATLSHKRRASSCRQALATTHHILTVGHQNTSRQD